MAFSKVSDTEVTGTGTISDLVTTINNTAYAETVGIRTVWLKSEMIVSGTGSELTIPAGWHVDVDTRLRGEDNAVIIVGSEDTYSPKEGASIYFNDPTPAGEYGCNYSRTIWYDNIDLIGGDENEARSHVRDFTNAWSVKTFYIYVGDLGENCGFGVFGRHTSGDDEIRNLYLHDQFKLHAQLNISSY